MKRDWMDVFYAYLTRAGIILVFTVIFMFLFASISKRFGVIGAMGFRESLAWGAAWAMVIGLRRGGK